MALLSDVNAVVTGSTKGIGRGIAMELSKEGATVLINHRGTRGSSGAHADLQETIRLIRDAGGPEPLVCEADMSSEEGARHLADIAIRELVKVDVWVNNVGLHLVTPALHQSMEEWESLYRLNTTSAFLGCREAYKIMKQVGRGSIINIASKMGMAGSAQNACYCSAKAAVIMMTRCLAAEWASEGIRVNAIAPGVTSTGPTFANVAGKPALEASLHYRTPLGRFAEPAEIGKVAVFLASGLSSYVTGATIACDGGWTAYGDYAGIPPERLTDWMSEFPRPHGN